MKKPPKKPKTQRKTAKFPRREVLAAICIQRHVRGYITRKHVQPLLIEKLLEDQEEAYRSQLMKIEEALTSDPLFNQSPIVVLSTPSPQRIGFELPLPLSQKKPQLATRPAYYNFDYYIAAALLIQRTYRGYAVRKQLMGGFHHLRGAITKIQRRYRMWVSKKSGQMELALGLISKQTSILTSTFASYQQLRSMILNKNSAQAAALRLFDERLVDAGLYSESGETHDLRRMNRQLKRQLKEVQVECQEKFERTALSCKATNNKLVRGIFDMKQQLEEAQRKSMEQMAVLVRGLAEIKADIDEEYDSVFK